jgi:hypothetical protein
MAAIHKHTYMETESKIDPAIKEMYDKLLAITANQSSQLNIKAISDIIRPYNSEVKNINKPGTITQILANLWCYVLKNLSEYTEDQLKTLSFVFMNLEEEGITGFILTKNDTVRNNIIQCRKANIDKSIAFVFKEALQPNEESIPNDHQQDSDIIKLSNTCVRACLDTVIKSSLPRRTPPSNTPSSKRSKRKGGRRRYKPTQKKLKSITHRKRR